MSSLIKYSNAIKKFVYLGKGLPTVERLEKSIDPSIISLLLKKEKPNLNLIKEKGNPVDTFAKKFSYLW